MENTTIENKELEIRNIGRRQLNCLNYVYFHGDKEKNMKKYKKLCKVEQKLIKELNQLKGNS